MTVTGGTLTVAYLTLLFTMSALIEDRDGVNAVAAGIGAAVTVLLLGAQRVRASRGDLVRPARGSSPRTTSGNMAVFLGALAVVDGGSGLLHGLDPSGDGPAFLVGGLVTAAVAATVWFVLRRQERGGAAQA